MCVSEEKIWWCSWMCAHVYDAALCGSTVRIVALGLWLVGHTCPRKYVENKTFVFLWLTKILHLVSLIVSSYWLALGCANHTLLTTMWLKAWQTLDNQRRMLPLFQKIKKQKKQYFFSIQADDKIHAGTEVSEAFPEWIIAL